MGEIHGVDKNGSLLTLASNEGAAGIIVASAQTISSSTNFVLWGCSLSHRLVVRRNV